MIKKDARFLAAAVAGALFLRLFKLGSQSLWVDEIISINKSIPKSGLGIWDYLQYNIQGPVHSFVVYLFHFVSGSDAWLRVPSALAGAAAVYYLYRWVDLWLGRPVARIAAAMLAVHPLHIHYSQEVRAYGFLVFFVTFAGYYFQKMLERESTKSAAAYVVGTALAALSNFSAAFIYAVQSVLFLVRRAFTARRLLRWALVSLAILILISPWVYRIWVVIDVHKLVTPVKPGEIVAEQRLRGETTVTAAAIPYLMYVFSVGMSLGPSTRDLHVQTGMVTVLREHWVPVVWVAVVFGFLALAGLWTLKRLGGGRMIQLLLYMLVPLGLLLALNWQNAKAFNARYLLVSLPAFVCIVAAGVSALPGLLKRAALVCVFATLAVSLANYYFDGEYAKEDIRGAARYVEAHIRPGECVLAPTVLEVFQHYFRGENPVYSVSAGSRPPREALEERLTKTFAGCGRVWYVRSREWDNDPGGELSTALGRTFRETERLEGFPGVVIVTYEH
ncbi:MAG: glycosyl transferase family 39 [Candidatus Krumholzibacteriota bacterium]|nr:glycosyl transferase family 39 [Candidatus Krumholzibacteriota bacterium]